MLRASKLRGYIVAIDERGSPTRYLSHLREWHPSRLQGRLCYKDSYAGLVSLEEPRKRESAQRFVSVAVAR